MTSGSLIPAPRALGAACACLLAAAQAAPAHGQELDLGLFAPTPQPTATFTIPEPVPRGHHTFHFALASDFAADVLDRTHSCSAQDSPQDRACVQDQTRARAQVPWTAHSALLFELSLFDLLSFGVRLPLALTRAQTSELAQQTYGGLGDLGLFVSGAVASYEDTRVGWQLATSLPTAGENTFSGEPYVTLTPGFTVTQGIGHVLLAAQVAYHLRKRHVVLGVERDDELRLMLGASYTFSPVFALIAEAGGQLGVGGRTLKRVESPSEIALGVRVGKLDAAALDVGMSTGAWLGERGLGAPSVRGFITLRSALGPSACSTGPEDLDGFEDADHCAELDNDADGVSDDADACPNDAEDRDGFQDNDGCPDLDNDADGLPDSRDLCPDNSEDLDGFQDGDGCPEPDNDEDGVADGGDHCRFDPEDRDGFEDDDGCPEPGPARPTVTRSGSRLLISDRVYFEDLSDTLRLVSAPLLDAVAATFKDLPGGPRLRVEGHTDDSGNPQYNVDLSYRRARAVVEYLKRQGIESERLEYVGHGSAHPLGPNNTPEGRALNRRVEFVLLGQ